MKPLPDWPLIEMADTNMVYIALMKQQCGYVAGEASALRTIAEELRSERKLYEFAPVWFETDEVARVTGDVLRKKQQEGEREQQLEFQKKKFEDKVREENGPRARALQDDIRRVVKDAAARVDGDAKDKFAPIEADGVYPEYVAWLKTRSADQWKTTEVTTEEIQDFGTIQWNGRPLDAIIVEIKVTQRNRILGKNDQVCFVFGLVNDAEFSMSRDPFGLPCDSSERSIAEWKARRQFKSGWNWEPEH
jgi:hypothetical protein